MLLSPKRDRGWRREKRGKETGEKRERGIERGRERGKERERERERERDNEVDIYIDRCKPKYDTHPSGPALSGGAMEVQLSGVL